MKGALSQWPSAAQIQEKPSYKPALTVGEVAVLMGLSRQTVTRLFEKETGVIVLKRPEAMHKRSYRSIRIPRTVYERVLYQLTARSRP